MHSVSEPMTLTTAPTPITDVLKFALAARAEQVEAMLDALMPPTSGMEKRLIDAMRYASLGGGKRLRGFLVIEVAQLFAEQAIEQCVGLGGGGGEPLREGVWGVHGGYFCLSAARTAIARE